MIITIISSLTSLFSLSRCAHLVVQDHCCFSALAQSLFMESDSTLAKWFCIGIFTLLPVCDCQIIQGHGCFTAVWSKCRFAAKEGCLLQNRTEQNTRDSPTLFEEHACMPPLPQHTASKKNHQSDIQVCSCYLALSSMQPRETCQSHTDFGTVWPIE